MKSSLLLGKLTGNNSCAVNILANSGIKETCGLACHICGMIIIGISFIFSIALGKRFDSIELSAAAISFGICLINLYVIGGANVISSVYSRNYCGSRIKHIALSRVVLNGCARDGIIEFIFADFISLGLNCIKHASSLRFNSAIILVCGDITAGIDSGNLLFDYSLNYSLNYLFLALKILLDVIVEGTGCGSGSSAIFLSLSFGGLALCYRTAFFRLISLIVIANRSCLFNLSGSYLCSRISLNASRNDVIRLIALNYNANYRLLFCGSCYSLFFCGSCYNILLVGSLIFRDSRSAGNNFCRLKVLEDDRNSRTKLGSIYLFVSGRLGGSSCMFLNSIFSALLSYIIGTCFFFTFRLGSILYLFCHLCSSGGCKNYMLECLSALGSICKLFVFNRAFFGLFNHISLSRRYRFNLISLNASRNNVVRLIAFNYNANYGLFFCGS